MSKSFNVTGACNPDLHYMVNIDQKIQMIKKMIDKGNYFTINRARQYGKTTTLGALDRYLRNEYVVVHLDFQMLSYEDFSSESVFVAAFAKAVLRELVNEERASEQIKEQLALFTDATDENARLSELFPCLSTWCAKSEVPIVLMIDEVDTASNNQIFLDFLAQLRAYFNARRTKNTPTFQSVILAGVYDIKNLKLKIQKVESDSALAVGDKRNSPWNIATDFRINMSFGANDIAGMLQAYEQDYHTGMDIEMMSKLIFDYTSGYPYLVSRICNIIDEQIGNTESYPTLASAWTKEGFLEAIKMILVEKNSLFESLMNKLIDYSELRTKIYDILFRGDSIAYNPDAEVIGIARIFGFIVNQDGVVAIANRIFEIRLYNYFLTSKEAEETEIYKMSVLDKNQFVQNGRLDMKLVLEKFVLYFNDLYGDKSERFLEAEGRRYFLLFLRPIINGVGNYYIESQTRGLKRTDVIVDYRGEQFVIELKIWKGTAYHDSGEQQLMEYLDLYHLNRGYLISFNFNKEKQSGVHEISIDGKVLVEAIV